MRARLAVLALLAALLASGCGDSPAAAPGAAVTDVTIRTVAGGIDGPSEPGQVVARSSSEWTDRWTAAGAASAEPDVSSVDFGDARVVGIFAGQKPTGGWRIDAGTPVAAAGGKLEIPYTVVGPGEGCMTTQAITSPYLVVAVEGESEADLVFTPSERREPC